MKKNCLKTKKIKIHCNKSKEEDENKHHYIIKFCCRFQIQKLSRWFYFLFFIFFWGGGQTPHFLLQSFPQLIILALLSSIHILQVILPGVVFEIRHSLKYSLTSSSSASVHFIHVDEEVFFPRSDVSSYSSSCMSSSSIIFSVKEHAPGHQTPPSRRRATASP